jgi:hypothetical protein
MELRIRQSRDKLKTSRLCLEKVAVVESGLKRTRYASAEEICTSKARREYAPPNAVMSTSIVSIFVNIKTFHSVRVDIHVLL